MRQSVAGKWRLGGLTFVVHLQTEMTCFSSCFSATKYTFLRCEIPICNKCSIFEENEDYQGWVAGKSVAFCEPRAKEAGQDVTIAEDNGTVLLKETIDPEK